MLSSRIYHQFSPNRQSLVWVSLYLNTNENYSRLWVSFQQHTRLLSRKKRSANLWRSRLLIMSTCSYFCPYSVNSTITWNLNKKKSISRFLVYLQRYSKKLWYRICQRSWVSSESGSLSNQQSCINASLILLDKLSYTLWTRVRRMKHKLNSCFSFWKCHWIYWPKVIKLCRRRVRSALPRLFRIAQRSWSGNSSKKSQKEFVKSSKAMDSKLSQLFLRP